MVARCGDESAPADVRAADSNARRDVRADWQCDCGGERFSGGLNAEKRSILVGQWVEFCRVTRGFTPDECPYQAHRDPFVGEVIRAYRACSEGGMGLAILYPDPPAVLVAGLDVFGLELNRARAWDHARREQERKARTGGENE